MPGQANTVSIRIEPPIRWPGLDAGKGDDRQEGVAQHVLRADAAFGQALGARRLDEVLSRTSSMRRGSAGRRPPCRTAPASRRQDQMFGDVDDARRSRRAAADRVVSRKPAAIPTGPRRAGSASIRPSISVSRRSRASTVMGAVDDVPATHRREGAEQHPATSARTKAEPVRRSVGGRRSSDQVRRPAAAAGSEYAEVARQRRRPHRCRAVRRAAGRGRNRSRSCSRSAGRRRPPRPAITIAGSPGADRIDAGR